jgi:hypothetical protein
VVLWLNNSEDEFCRQPDFDPLEDERGGPRQNCDRFRFSAFSLTLLQLSRARRV